MAIYVNGVRVAGNGMGGPVSGGGQAVPGPAGPQGEPGEGVPAGGTAGQVLAKASAADYDTEWVDLPAAGGGVTSFNGRAGAVAPQAGDYTAAMVGAVSSPTVAVIQALTQAEYDALATKSASTLYLIRG